MDNVLPIIGVGFLVFIVIFPFLKIDTRPRCRECGSKKIGVQKTVTGMRAVDYSSGEPGGGGASTQLQYDMKYRCNECQAQWTTTATKTR